MKVIITIPFMVITMVCTAQINDKIQQFVDFELNHYLRQVFSIFIKTVFKMLLVRGFLYLSLFFNYDILLFNYDILFLTKQVVF